MTEDRRLVRRRQPGDGRLHAVADQQRGHPEALNPRNGNYGRGFGDYFGYRELLEQWLEQGDLEGLELDVVTGADRAAGRRRHRRRRRDRRRRSPRSSAGGAPSSSRWTRSCHARRLRAAPRPRGDDRRAHRRRRRLGAGLVGVGHRRRRGPRPVRRAGREHGRLDAVVNVAGITRPTSFATGSEEDWRGVLAVHLDGYLNVLGAALPIMAAAGARPDPRRHLRLGLAGGRRRRLRLRQAGRRLAHLAARSRGAPPGVVVNAMSPIAVTRMVTAALERARAASGGGRGAGRPPAGCRSARCPSPRTSARSAPTSSARTSRGARAG